jgi:hypothetical protein
MENTEWLDLEGPRREFPEYDNGNFYLPRVVEKWVERCKKCIACQGRYFEKETVNAPPQSSELEQ